jgi:hypothetical protein
MRAAAAAAISTGVGAAKTHRETRRSAAIVQSHVGISLTGACEQNLADCLTKFSTRTSTMARWIARLTLGGAMTMTSGVFLFGTILLAIAALLTCNLLEEIAVQPPQAPMKAEA